MRFRLLRKEIALAQGNAAEALDLEQQGYAWAAARDANEVLCWAHLLRAQIELAGSPARKSAAAAIDSANKGLRLARSCGFALFHIDLLIVRAQASLAAGRPDDAEQDLLLALYGKSTGRESAHAASVTSATAQSCGYAWGTVTGLHWLGITHLVRAAQLLHGREFNAAQRAAFPDPVRAKLSNGITCFQSAVDIWKKLAASVSEDLDLGGSTYAVLDELDRGRLPSYPLYDIGLGEPED